jgi:hypothetical protein
MTSDLEAFLVTGAAQGFTDFRNDSFRPWFFYQDDEVIFLLFLSYPCDLNFSAFS